MDTAALMALSPLDGRYQEKMNSLHPFFSEYGLIKFRIMVEIKWLETLTNSHLPEVPTLTTSAKKNLKNLIEHFSPQDALRVKEIEAQTNHDVKAVEYFIKERIQHDTALSRVSEFIHFGCTSEDINNLAYGLMIQTAKKEVLIPALDQMLSLLKKMAHDYADLAMLSRTHGQAATPTTLGKEIANVVARLQRQRQQLETVSLLGKMNGASGNYNALTFTYPNIDWQAISQHFVTELGLQWNAYTTQIEPHDTLSELFAIIVRINTILIDFCRDIWGYIALHYFTQKSIANEVGSSTMPHKINPIDFENAEGNLGIANALLEHMILKLPLSRWQRDLTDSTVLRNMGVAWGHSLLAYQSLCKGIGKLKPNPALIQADLEAHWEVLAEAIQTVMRRYQLEQPYEKLKEFTRGKQIDEIMLKDFIQNLSLPNEIKKQLLTLTPADYLGYAASLAKEI